MGRFCSAICRVRAHEQRREKAKRYGYDARRRAQKAGQTVEWVFRADVFERDRWQCQICKRPVPKNARHPNPLSATVDHIIPISQGGAHSMANVQLAHLTCNLKKCAKKANDQLRLAFEGSK